MGRDANQARVTDRHLSELVKEGFTVVEGFLTKQELTAARAGMLQYFPTADELASAPMRYRALLEDAEHQQNEFPFAADALNLVSVHPEIIGFVERLLGDSEILLSQSAIWAKYAGTGSFEQPMHTDFEGNTLVYPRDDGTFRQVNIILYYTDVDETMGPTCVVPQSKTRGQSLLPPFRPRDKFSSLYRLEKPVKVKAGDMLIFSMRTLHRASEMLADHGVRFSHHLVYRSARHAFAGYHQWSAMGEKLELKRFIEIASPRQREMIGFPAPGHAYWNEETLAGVAARYPKLDMKPYLEAAGSR